MFLGMTVNLRSFLIGLSWPYPAVPRNVREQTRAMVLIREFLVIGRFMGCLGFGSTGEIIWPRMRRRALQSPFGAASVAIFRAWRRSGWAEERSRSAGSRSQFSKFHSPRRRGLKHC